MSDFADTILTELNWPYFNDAKFRALIRDCLQELDKIEERQEHVIDLAVICLGAVWENYFDKRTGDIFKRFASVQKALFGLELDEGGPRRYREHILHMFHVWILGARILAPLTTEQQGGFEPLRSMVRVVTEPDQVGTWANFSPYTPPKRLFYLWTLMATFHDIGIPIQHLSNMRGGLNEYFGYFGRDLAELLVHLEPAVASQMHYYFSLMGRIFLDGVHLDEKKPGQYLRPPDPEPYLVKSLGDALGGEEPDHGVISALCLFRSIERAFMSDRDDYNLTLAQFKDYVDLVVEQDVTRAALAIALHNLRPAKYPKLFPIEFSRLPLTFVLLLCDELQEFYRVEGITSRGVVPLARMPDLATNWDQNRLHIELTYEYTQPKPEIWESMEMNADAYRKSVGDTRVTNSHSDHVRDLWHHTVDTLKKKLSFNPGCPVHVRVHVKYQHENSYVGEIGTWDSDT